jgi:hypothetical protein
VIGQGIHGLPVDLYHADPAERPSLSASIAAILCSQSPAHARAAHPRLNPDHQREEKGHYDVGTAAHAIVLEGRSIVEVVDAPDWRTNAAKDARDAARAAGRIPLLAHTLAEVEAMVEAIHEQLGDHEAEPPLFTDGKPERTLIWEEDGITCRALVDWLRDDYAAVDDLKTTSRSANPEAYSRALFGVGGDVQAAFYIRGVEKITGVRPEFRWCVVETSPPFALSVISPAPDVLTIGMKKIDWAITRWRRCLQTDEWPGYEPRVAYAELPAYEESRWLEKELREVAA